MNDQANKILIDLLQKASDGVDAAVSFSKAQIPDVVHQLLVWNFVYSFIPFIISTVVMVFLLRFGIRQCILRRKKDNPELFVETLVWNEYGYMDESILFVVLIYSMLLLSAAFGSYLNLDWLQIWIAPKLYLIQYAAHLIK